MTWGGQEDSAFMARRRRLETMGVKPAGKRWSNYIAGRMNCFRKLEKGKPILVSAYLYNGKMRYSDPVKEKRRGEPVSKPGPGVLYRIRVTPKGKLA